MKKLLFIAMLLAPIGAIAQEDFVRLPADSSGKRLRMRTSTQNALTVYSQAFFIDDGSGSGPLGLVGSPLFTTFTNSAIAATQSGTWNINNISGTISLPTGAASETTLAGIKAGTDKIPSSPATDRTTAGSPFSIRLSDGSAFYKATTPSDQQHTIIDSNSTDFATQTSLAAIKAKTDNIPSDPSREGGLLSTAAKQDTGNTSLASIKTNSDTLVTNTSGLSTSANQTTQVTTENAINAKLPSQVNGSQPVIIMQTTLVAPPLLTAQQLANPLLYRSAMKQFCAANLCPAVPFGK